FGLCLWRNGEPRLCLLWCRQFPVVPEDHLRGVTSFQRYAVYVLKLGKPIADERMSQCVLFPFDTRFRSSVAECLEIPRLAVRPYTLVITRHYRQPAGEIVSDGHDAARRGLCFVRGHFDEVRAAFNVAPIQAQNLLGSQPCKRG